MLTFSTSIDLLSKCSLGLGLVIHGGMATSIMSINREKLLSSTALKRRLSHGSTGNKALRELGPHLSNVLLGCQSHQFQSEPFAHSSMVGPSKMCLDGQGFDFPLLNREAFSLLV